MRIGVISDSHGDKTAVSWSLKQMKTGGKPDVLIHLGDGADDITRYLQDYARCFLIQGNWDSYQAAFPAEEAATLDGIPFLLTHGHTYRVKMTRDLLLARARETGAQAALFGHTHVPYCGMHHGILLLNPGSCANGRYAVITLQKGLIDPQLY